MLNDIFYAFKCELSLFLGGDCTLNDVFCRFKAQGAIRVCGVPLPETNPIYRSAFCYIIKFFHNRAEIARLVG